MKKVMPVRAVRTLALALALLVSATGVAGAQTPAAPAVAAPLPANTAPQVPVPPSESVLAIDANYVLGLGDVIEVSVVGQAEYTARARISPDGTVLLPLIGSVGAVNLKPAELATQIGAALAKGGYYAKPVVRIEVLVVASRFVTVLGQVGSPGLIPLDRAYHLSEILARVGARFGTGSEHVIITRANGSQQKLIMAEIATGAVDRDPVVLAGDKIYVPAAEAQVFYLTGAVRAPGAFPLTPGVTIRTALARAGGVSENGSEKKFEIFREGKKVSGAKLDSEVQVGDIIKFGERMF